MYKYIYIHDTVQCFLEIFITVSLELFEIRREVEVQRLVAVDRIYFGRTEGSRLVLVVEGDLLADLQEAGTGIQQEDLLGSRKEDVPAGGEEGGSWLEQAGSCPEGDILQGSQWSGGNLEVVVTTRERPRFVLSTWVTSWARGIALVARL